MSLDLEDMDDLNALEQCARSWAPQARLLGNVRASTIIGLCRELRALRELQSEVRKVYQGLAQQKQFVTVNLGAVFRALAKTDEAS